MSKVLVIAIFCGILISLGSGALTLVRGKDGLFIMRKTRRCNRPSDAAQRAGPGQA